MKFFNNDNGEAIGETGIAQASKYKKCHLKLGKKVARYQIGQTETSTTRGGSCRFVLTVRQLWAKNFLSCLFGFVANQLVRELQANNWKELEYENT
ncbi:hypothetical protein T10_11755 [Trichinella papuae]|uniref:Uncharacterized protein n=1 Tax=Trichinella papuae TaxID=268474 RepID=A0A0V1N2I5_9BILA|nr:hypothetical protein T10_11755 [Trichinella papuae]